ncbi:MAG: AmmeMemoRadiSam system protein A [Eubacteriales bacterium]|nr:AmmeMemoRadiSam system protein A [Eubacteriales bacterium]MDD4323331.1 AmmeMemoRadiSam system protein A [Eubacteriales bacterium]MDD4540642.1 AmmeMemoRadiSam system protein A [Eubacteriales bacterium]
MILKAYVLPHPPIILPEVGRGEEKKIEDTSAAYHRAAREIAELKPETIIICSSHAPLLRSAFYVADAEGAAGDLRAFGIHSIHETVDYDQELAKILQEVSFERSLALEKTHVEARTLDHGTLLPLVFIHQYYENFKLLRLGMSLLSPEEHYKFGQAVSEAVQRSKKRTVFIASGDLSHVLKADGPYGYREEGPALDNELTEIFASGDLDRLFELDEALVEGAQECGLRSFQILAGVLAGSDFDSELYSYEGTFGVGYAVAVFTPQEKNKDKEDPYLKLAQDSVESFIKHGTILPTPPDLPAEMLEQQSGVFVTLYKDNCLRGCIGTIEPSRANIAEEIIHNAVSSAKYDPRFPSVQQSELDQLEYSVDILGEKEEVSSVNELDPERYGVIVSNGRRRGLLLPRLEGVDTAEDQLAIALIKAGLDPDKEYKIERFEVHRHERS